MCRALVWQTGYARMIFLCTIVRASWQCRVCRQLVKVNPRVTLACAAGMGHSLAFAQTFKKVCFVAVSTRSHISSLFCLVFRGHERVAYLQLQPSCSPRGSCGGCAGAFRLRWRAILVLNRVWQSQQTSQVATMQVTAALKEGNAPPPLGGQAAGEVDAGRFNVA